MRCGRWHSRGGFHLGSRSSALASARRGHIELSALGFARQARSLTSRCTCRPRASARSARFCPAVRGSLPARPQVSGHPLDGATRCMGETYSDCVPRSEMGDRVRGRTRSDRSSARRPCAPDRSQRLNLSSRSCREAHHRHTGLGSFASTDRNRTRSVYAARICPRPHPDDSFCPFFHMPSVWPHTHHVHVVQAGGAEERRTLAFRDYLRDHPAGGSPIRAAQARAGTAAQRGEFSFRQAYADAKTAFVISITERAVADGYPREP